MNKSLSLQILREQYRGSKVKLTRTPELDNMLSFLEDAYQLNRSRIVRYLLGEYYDHKTRSNINLHD